MVSHAVDFGRRIGDDTQYVGYGVRRREDAVEHGPDIRMVEVQISCLLEAWDGVPTFPFG